MGAFSLNYSDSEEEMDPKNEDAIRDVLRGLNPEIIFGKLTESNLTQKK